MLYCKRGNIYWAKLSQFSRVPRKFFHEYLFILYKLRIMALFKCFKHKAPQSFPIKNFIGWNLRKFSPMDLSLFMVFVFVATQQIKCIAHH